MNNAIVRTVSLEPVSLRRRDLLRRCDGGGQKSGKTVRMNQETATILTPFGIGSPTVRGGEQGDL